MRKSDRAKYIRRAEQAAQELGIPAYGPDVDAAIVDFCRQRMADWARDHGWPETTSELLDLVAVSLGVEFFEVHDESDLSRLFERIPPEREPIMATVRTELDDATDALMICRQNREPWERPYLAIINCCGWHWHRRFFSKWHELAHRLIDGEQLRFAFRRTPTLRKDPEEILVDKIAGALAFYAPAVDLCIDEELDSNGFGFATVDAVRARVAPDASRQATAIAVMEHLQQPAWSMRCEVSLKPSQTRAAPKARTASVVPALRVVEVSANDAAMRSGTRIHQWMRVPQDGVVARAHASRSDLRGRERLESWETSDGGSIGRGALTVDVSIVEGGLWVLAAVA